MSALSGMCRPGVVRAREGPGAVPGLRYPGEAPAVVLREDRCRAEDGAAEVTFSVDPLPAVVTPTHAADDSVRLFDGLGNVALRGEAGQSIDASVWQEAAAVVQAGTASNC